MMIASAISSRNCVCSGRVMKRLIRPACSTYPNANRTAAIGTSITSGSRPSAVNSTSAIYMAMVIISPWAKLTTRTTPKITERPSAISP